jgi:hypothetical protein
MKYIVVAMVALASCGHAPPKGHWNAGSRQLCVREVCYVVGALPASWRLIHQQSGALGYFNDDASAIVAANVTCAANAEAAPLDALTRQLLVGYTDRQLVSQERVALDRREALRTRLSARLDGVPIELDLFVLKRNGCIFDLSFVAPADSFARRAPDFASFVGGFAQTKGAGDRGGQVSG